MTAIVWFRRDLRLTDNPAWAAATAQHDEIVPLYVLDRRLLDHAGPFRRRQLLAELAALDDALREHGGRLRLRAGDPATVVPDEQRSAGASAVYANADVTPYARRRDDAVTRALHPVPLSTTWGGLVHAPGRVRTNAGTLSRVFTAFHRVWARTPLEPWPSPGPGRPTAAPGEAIPPPDGEPPFPPGEHAALDRLEAWLAHVDHYGETRDLPAVDGTSALSAALRFGTLSPRTVASVVGDATPGRAAFVRQLAWRDWYAHLTAEHPDIAARSLQPRYDHVAWRDDPDGLAAWKDGRTGFPFVDAGMRQLAQTGWMHNRVRLVAASFLVKDLLIDWRLGERWFRHLLVDGDVAQNAGNWQWVAGTGADAAPYFRVFNPITQGRRFDPDGAYIRRWVPELAHLDARRVHDPAGAVAGYPHPIVDHAAARHRCIAAYKVAAEVLADETAAYDRRP